MLINWPIVGPLFWANNSSKLVKAKINFPNNYIRVGWLSLAGEDVDVDWPPISFANFEINCNWLSVLCWPKTHKQTPKTENPKPKNPHCILLPK